MIEIKSDHLLPVANCVGNKHAGEIVAWTDWSTEESCAETTHDARIKFLEFALQPTARSVGFGNTIPIGPFQVKWQSKVLLELANVYDSCDSGLLNDTT